MLIGVVHVQAQRFPFIQRLKAALKQTYTSVNKSKKKVQSRYEIIALYEKREQQLKREIWLSKIGVTSSVLAGLVGYTFAEQAIIGLAYGGLFLSTQYHRSARISLRNTQFNKDVKNIELKKAKKKKEL